jgi:CRISPR-associated protein Cmr6
MSKFANAGLLYERYYYYDTDAGQYFDFKDKEDDDIALPFFRGQNTRLCASGLPLLAPAPATPEEGITPISLFTVYPGLATGTGNTHETGSKGESKLGFFFDYSSGQPVIPGSSVKGVLRSAFPQWEKHKNTSEEIKDVKARFIYSLVHAVNFDAVPQHSKAIQAEVTALEEAIFEGKLEGKNLSVYNKDIFYDAVVIAASTHRPTQGKIIGTDSITPHGDDPLKNPIPIPFIKILPGIQLQFRFKLSSNGLPKEAKKKLFKALLEQFGAGAKTNVGYGQLESR